MKILVHLQCATIIPAFLNLLYYYDYDYDYYYYYYYYYS